MLSNKSSHGVLSYVWALAAQLICQESSTPSHPVIQSFPAFQSSYLPIVLSSNHFQLSNRQGVSLVYLLLQCEFGCFAVLHCISAHYRQVASLHLSISSSLHLSISPSLHLFIHIHQIIHWMDVGGWRGGEVERWRDGEITNMNPYKYMYISRKHESEQSVR